MLNHRVDSNSMEDLVAEARDSLGRLRALAEARYEEAEVTEGLSRAEVVARYVLALRCDLASQSFEAAMGDLGAAQLVAEAAPYVYRLTGGVESR